MDELFMTKPCSGGSMLSISLKRGTRINLESAAKAFGVTKKSAAVLPVIVDGVKVSIYSSGRLVVSENDAQRACTLARKVYEKLGVL